MWGVAVSVQDFLEGDLNVFCLFNMSLQEGDVCRSWISNKQTNKKPFLKTFLQI